MLPQPCQFGFILHVNMIKTTAEIKFEREMTTIIEDREQESTTLFFLYPKSATFSSVCILFDGSNG